MICFNRGVAQLGQSAAFGTQRSQVQILSPRLKLLLKRVRIREGEVFWIYVYYFTQFSQNKDIDRRQGNHIDLVKEDMSLFAGVIQW